MPEPERGSGCEADVRPCSNAEIPIHAESYRKSPPDTSAIPTKEAKHDSDESNLDPKAIAYNRWFQMNRGAEPFDYEELQRLYAAIPKEEQEKS